MDFKAFLSQITKVLQALSLRQRIVIASSVFLVVAFLVFLSLYSGGKKSNEFAGYSVLFNDVSPKDSAAIVEQLNVDKIPYKLANESTILVPTQHVYQERIAIASLGIPKNSKIGYEIFDKQEFGATDFDQKIKYLRALEGELGRTIESLAPILRANVHIALPKESVFTSKEQFPTASVVLDIESGMKLNQKQIIGIKNLVASSVSKLTPENVKLINQDGVSLGVNEEGFDDDLIANQMRYRQEFQDEYERKIIKVISPIIGGPKKVVAKVNIDFNFARKDSVSEVYDPNSVPRSEQTLEEKREGFTPKDVGGVPGAVSNIGPVEGLQDGNLKEQFSKATTTTNYEISKKVTNIKDPFATIVRVSAAVVVDGKYKKEIKDEEEVFTFMPLQKEELEHITNLVKQAIGYNEKRGDQVTVSNFEFKTSSDKPEPVPTEVYIQKATDYLGPLMPFFKYIFVILILWFFYKKVILPFLTHMTENFQEPEEEILEEEEFEEEEDTLEKFQKAKKKVEEQLGMSSNMNEEDLRYEVLLEKLRLVANDKSEELVNIIQNLLENEMSEFGRDS